ncbi:LL-diaminopimelate aminotransferase [Neglectibacter timonensis]|uniref:LL-diaminopimelate aminotransferase n=1 Tax=Neglectibacter timonensis TaxID=1776382 RepID=A0ABT1S113_9FIRM|nr:LL-diaminopimelate aminotransferase [Neglectibacter timonensis]MCQ4840611.1 LL-diaminopimelate aminotransferase [Neglectibacter timonensis]MCQ4844777.1 LL-diaminopimelate aminotransferase [Neglectibacter timonensis]MEE0730810.1 LL-diaminopimelate aminotransferase [Oscillospiraceae bacterium]
MMKLNGNFQNLQQSYLFVTISQKVDEYGKAHPQNQIIKMGIGDVTQPLAPAVIEAMHRAADEMSCKETFRGYSPDSDGYPFLREAIAGYYKGFGVDLDASEVFVGDGAKSDVGNIVDLFDVDNTVLVPDPVYPVYVDTNLISGREILYLDANEDNGFLPLPEKDVHADIIYLCSPNNPTGAVYDREQLQAWVDYALENRAVLLFDAAYESFITGEGLPHSIFEIPGAERCAIEFCSFSKTAGFTGMRCGYTVIRKELQFEGVQVSKLWERRQGCKFNGVSYITQRAAEAVFSPQGRRQVMETIAYYQNNARVMAKALEEMGIWFTGGANSPYLWMKCPDGMDSWEYFDYLLNEAEIVGTPGAGFGKNGEGYFRLTAFGDAQKTVEAMERMKKLKK